MSEEVLLTQMNAMVDSVDKERALHGRRRARHDVPRTPPTRCSGWSTPGPSSSTRPTPSSRHDQPARAPGRPCCRRRPTTRRTSRPSPRAWPTSPARCAPPTRTCARSCRVVPAAVREVDSLLQGSRAHPAGVPVQPAHHQPGAHHQHARRSSRCWSSSRTSSRPGSPGRPVTATATSTCSSTTTWPRAPRATSRPPSGVPPPTRVTDRSTPAKCKSGPPQNLRGYDVRAQLGCRHVARASGYRVAPYDARTGTRGHGDGDGPSSWAPEEDCTQCSGTTRGSGCSRGRWRPMTDPAPAAGPAGTSWRWANIVLMVLALVLVVATALLFTKGAAAAPGDSEAETLSRDYAEVTQGGHGRDARPS